MRGARLPVILEVVIFIYIFVLKAFQFSHLIDKKKINIFLFDTLNKKNKMSNNEKKIDTKTKITNIKKHSNLKKKEI